MSYLKEKSALTDLRSQLVHVKDLWAARERAQQDERERQWKNEEMKEIYRLLCPPPCTKCTVWIECIHSSYGHDRYLQTGTILKAWSVQLEQILENLSKLLNEEEFVLQWRHLRQLVLLLLRLIQFLTNPSRFATYPNCRRPKCTTMPWTIWPSLVVLWGVCWMFVVPWSGAIHFDDYLEEDFGEEQAWPLSQRR